MAYISEPFELPQQMQTAPERPKPQLVEVTRYTSIDVLKGVAIICLWLMMFTIADPNASVQLKPGTWGHPTFADFIYPSLIVAIGAGLVLAAKFSSQKREASGRYFLSALSRAFWLVLFGIL